MRVCHVWEVFWPFGIGGVERYILSLSSYLANHSDTEFSLLTGRSTIQSVTKNIKKFEDAGFLKVHRLGPSPADLVCSVVFEALGSKPAIVKKMQFASLCHYAAKSKLAQSAEVFHVHGIWGLYDLEYIMLGVYLSQHFNKPLVVSLHGSFVGDPLIGGMPLETPVVKDILTNYADAITTYSKEIFGILEKMGLGKKTHLVVNFVDTLQFKNPSSSPIKKGNNVVYVGRLEAPQTPEILVEAFKNVHARVPSAKMQIVGYGTLYEKLQGMIHKYGLEETVFLMGKQTNVRKFLWESDIFISTNFGYLSSLEAWSAGLALVAPDFGIFTETVKNGSTGLLVKQHDSDALASALISLLENRELREKIASDAFEQVKNYDIRTMAPKFLDIYNSVLKE
jgi:L-malate glycosyltransferase